MHPFHPLVVRRAGAMSLPLRLLVALVTAAVLLAVPVSGALAAAAAQNPVAVANQAFELFQQGRFEELRARFAAEVRDKVTVAQLEAGARAVAAQLGKVVEVGEPQVTATPAGTQVAIPLRFEKGNVGLYVTVTPAGELLGFLFGPPPPAAAKGQAGEQSESPQPVADYTPPAYVDPSRFEERAVTVGAAPGLPGTFSVPKGASSYPAVVLVHGSGPQDRDETVGANKPFRDLAGGLASQGIAVLRYDKRTYLLARDPQFAEKAALKASDITPDVEIIDDAVAAVKWLARQPGVRGVVVMGHSLGGMLAPEIARRAGDAATGVVVLAGNARPLERLVVEQLEYLARLDGTVTPDEQLQIDEARALSERLQSRSLPPDAPVMGASAGYFYALQDLLPVPIARRLSVPFLVLSGGRDYQVPAADYEAWQHGLAGRPNVTFRRYESLNHLFVPGEGPSSPQEYAQPGHVAREVVDYIASWIRAISG